MDRRQRESQRGMGLVVIIGIVAALAIMAASMVALTLNVRHNTYTDRVQKTSFNVAEGAMDSGMYMLASQWPFRVDSVKPTFDSAGFRQLYPSSQYPDPDPGRGSFVVVDYYENLTPVNKAVKYDSNGDLTMWLVSQVSTGPRATRIQSLVRMSYYQTGLPRGIALYAAGDLDANGGGNNPKIEVEVAPPTGYTTTVMVGGDIIDGVNPVNAAGIARIEGSAGDDVPTLADIFPQSLVESLVTLAQEHGRYFTSFNAAGNSPVDSVWSPQGGFSGLVVVQTNPGDTVTFAGNTDLNSEARPGIFMVLGGGTLDWRGNGQYYGVVYCDGPVDVSRGTADIHGMVLCADDQAMKGTPHIQYNDNCIAKLDATFPAMVRQVPNSWRELQPAF
jgi:hypothetical protein